VIASHRHRLIFVKTRKTAGTSIEIALSAVCGDEDVITPLDADDEVLRVAAGARGPQHHERRDQSIRSRLLGHTVAVQNHMPASSIVRLLGRETWDAYFTFAVERNPWDRAVSFYYFRTRRMAEPMTFSTFLRSTRHDRLSNWDLYAQDGTVLVDRVLRYEHLDEELADVWARLSGPVPELGHAKGGFRPSEDWRALYSDDDAALVAAACGREIELFGYTFDPG
jgi:hypothetical protein